MDKVQKIREKVERIFKHVKDSNFESDSGAFYYLKDLLEYIDSLQEEPVSEKKCIFTKDSYTDEDRKALCDDCKEKCEYNKKEDPVSEDLEEAAKHYLYSNILYNDVYVGEPTDKDCIEMFKAGAKWQKEQKK